MIPALVLTAGLATRLRPLSFVRAKAAVPVAGEALVRRILRQLAAAGVADAVLNLHHLPHTLSGAVGDGADLGVRVRYSWEMPVLGSAGGPRRALPLMGSPTFLIVNGDTLTDIDVTPLVQSHRASGALVTVAVVPNTMPEKYSGLAIRDGIVTGFVPRGVSPSFHFLGVQIAEAAAFERLPDGVPSEFRQVVLDNPGRVHAHVLSSAEFFDIGTPHDYLRTSLLFAEREGYDTNYPVASGFSRKIPSIHPTAHVESSVLWDDVEVGAGAYLRECVVTDGVRVPDDTSWTGVTIRIAARELAPGERRIDGLAIASIDG